MSIPSVVTRGFGSFGSVNFLPTLGYSLSGVIAGPFCFTASQLVVAGASAKQLSYAGDSASQIVNAGRTIDQIVNSGEDANQIVNPGVSASQEGCC